MYLCEFLLYAFLISSVIAAENGSPCVTPNGENATCISLNACAPIKQAIVLLEDDALDFAKKSQCGFENGAALVCCGSAVTNAPSTTVIPIELPTRPFIPHPALPIDDSFLPDNSLCGLQLKQTSDRIVGGRVTDIDEFPWMVALKYTQNDGTSGGFRCSGTLINHRYVLTAAQCLSIPGYNLTEIRLGEWNLSSVHDCVFDTDGRKTCADPVRDIPIVEKLPHPFYSRKSGNNDIALLRVDQKIEYTDYIRPICLPPSDYPPPPPGSRMHISGWGITQDGSPSDVKLKVNIPMQLNQVCVEAYLNTTNIKQNQACAGGEEGKGACSGDSGGPLMRTYEKRDEIDEEQWFQEGIIYRNFGCGHRGVPGVYTRVSRYLHWILNNVEYT